jgi:3',5'-cyclic AMP phosphodiesterase CpdA
MKSTINIAIISDLHCKHSSGNSQTSSNTYLTSDLLKKPVNRNPVESLKLVIKDKGLRADLLLCPGDITDKMDKQGLVTGWDHLEDLKVVFNAELLVATVGNHDVDSRKQQGKYPFQMIKDLSDNFPTPDKTQNSTYWSSNFSILSTEIYDLLIFNSCYSHVGEAEARESIITSETLQELDKLLSKIKDNGKSKIAMCHHHPMKHSNMDYKDGDSIEKGDLFLTLLEKKNFKLVIHGHKHDPRLNYSGSLPIFGCGSFSSMANLLDLGAENTFHFVELNIEDNNGIIKTWIYRPKSGWTQKLDTYFPCFTGFGARPDIQSLANQCVTYVNSQDETSIKYDNLIRHLPVLKYLIPSEQEKLNELVEKQFVTFVPKLPNRPEKVSKYYK